MTKRIQIPSNTIRNPLVSHHAIYLYTILKTMTSSLKVTAYTTTILEKANWNDRRTLKKYLIELNKLDLISLNFQDFPINKPIIFNINPIPKSVQFTQVDQETIFKIITVSQNTVIETKTKNIINKYNVDLKEMALRLFYLYEHYYNRDYNIAFPSYRTINQETKISNIYIKSLNNLFHKNNLVIVNIGNKVDQHKRSNNTYIPICDRKELDKQEVKPKDDSEQEDQNPNKTEFLEW